MEDNTSSLATLNWWNCISGWVIWLHFRWMTWDYHHRQDAAKRQPAGIPTSQKSTFLPRMGDSLHRFMSNLAPPRGTWVRLTVQNFTPIGARRWERGPKIWNFSTFW